MAIEAKLKHDKALGAYVLTFAFEKWEYTRVTAMAAVIREFVPGAAREYNSDTKEWFILEPFFPPIRELLTKGNFKIIEEKVIAPEDFFYNQGIPTEHIVSKETLANQLLALLGITAEELADFNRAKKAYRRKALELHPDRHPENAGKMSELNSIWSAYNEKTFQNIQ